MVATLPKWKKTVLIYVLAKVLKNGPSKTCGRDPMPNL